MADQSQIEAEDFRTRLTARFWPKVKKGDGCWLWTGSTDKKGYGRIATKRPSGPMPAQRASWIISFDKIPDGLWVLHKCDNPKCVRPDHLFLGTAHDNTQDMLAKGRQANGHLITRGEKAAKAKLTRAKVLKIRVAHADGASQRSLARKYSVRQYTIFMIVHRRSWAHV